MPHATPQEGLELLRSGLQTRPQLFQAHLEPPHPGASAHELSLNATFCTNQAAALAVIGETRWFDALCEWVEDAVPTVRADCTPQQRLRMLDDLATVRWLRGGAMSMELLGERVDAYEDTGLRDIDMRLHQVLRTAEAGRVAQARSALNALLVHPAAGRRVPTTVRLATVLNKSLEQLASGTTPGPTLERQFREQLRRLWRTSFTYGMYAEIVPWMRLYQRIFAPAASPRTVMGWLREDPITSFPVPQLQ